MRIVLEFVAVVCFLGGFAFAETGFEKFAFALAILAVIVTSDLTKTSSERAEKGKNNA